MNLEKTEIRRYHFFYIGFFLGYFLLIYFLLYHPNGLFPFQVNIHFFSNVIGSLSKRYLAEMTPYALLLYLIFYLRKQWLRVGLIAVFLLLFAVNVLEIFYYFYTKANVQYYVLKGFEWQLFLSYLGPWEVIALLTFLVTLGALSVLLYRIRSTSKDSSLKRGISLFILTSLVIGGHFIPVVYSPHKEVLSTDILIKKQYRLEGLETPGYLTIAKEIRYEHFPPGSFYQTLNSQELERIASQGLTSKLTSLSEFSPKKIIFIVAESLNQDFISYYNEEIPKINPFLSALFEKYPHIDEFYPSGTFTLYGLASLLCGHTSTERLLKDDQYECLPNLLAKNGYHTEFIRGFSKYYLGENVFFGKIGYKDITALEEFDDIDPTFRIRRPYLYSKWGFSDDYLFDEVIRRLRDHSDEKLFLTLLTVDTHSIRDGRCYRERTPQDPEHNLLFSHACFDELLTDFFNRIEQERLFDEDTLIVLTADHLISRYSELPGVQESNGFTKRPGRIPLLFISKNSLEFTSAQGSQIDVSPTILDLLDIEVPDYYMGKSLVSNPDAIPMGQDRIFAYMMIDDEFHSLDLLRGNSNSFKLSGGQFMRLFSDSQEEISMQIERMRQENNQSFNSDTTLLKWYRNQLWY